MRAPSPIRSLDKRLPAAGRIRIGVKRKSKTGKDVPSKIDTFRFTSQDRASIEQVSALYGGSVEAWEVRQGAGQWQVVTEAKTLRVALPPDPLGGTPIYELWAKGGCQRRCDGVDCELPSGGGPEGGDPQLVPCLCAQRGAMECKVVTRLSVILPDIRFLGVWRLDTGSWNVAHEMPGMVDLIGQMQDRGIQRAELRLEERSSQRGAIYVPALGFDASAEELAAGGQRLTALPAPDAYASPPQALSAWANSVSTADDIVEAEVIEEAFVQPAYHPDPDLVAAWRDALTTTQQNKVLRIARDGAELDGLTLPRSFEEIPVETIDRLMAAGWPANGAEA